MSIQLATINISSNINSIKGKIFTYNNTLYSIFSEKNQTDSYIKIYNNSNGTFQTIYNKFVAIYDYNIIDNRLWICGKYIIDNTNSIGFYASSLFVNDLFQTITDWTEVSDSLFLYNLLFINQIIHYTKVCLVNSQYQIYLNTNNQTDYLIYSDPYCTIRELLYINQDLYFVVETIDPTDNLIYLNILKQSNYDINSGITELTSDIIQDPSMNILFNTTLKINNQIRLMYFNVATMVQINNISNSSTIYNIVDKSIVYTFSVPNVYFQSLSRNNQGYFGLAYNYTYYTLKYIFIPINSDGTIQTNKIILKNSTNYISNDRELEYVDISGNIYLLLESKSSPTQVYSNVVTSNLIVNLNSPNASVGSDPHVYPLFSQPFDLKNISNRKLYTLFEMDKFNIKSHMSGFKTGIFFDKVYINNNGHEIKIDFNSKKIKGINETSENFDIVSDPNINYSNKTNNKKYAKSFQPKPMKSILFDNLKYPLSLMIDFETRYLHFKFLDQIPNPIECSGIIV